LNGVFFSGDTCYHIQCSRMGLHWTYGSSETRMSTIARDGLTGGAVAASGTGAGSVALAGAVTRGAVGLAVLRVVLGIVFAAHGAQKVFVMGIPGLAESFAAVGVPLAGIAA